MKINSQPRFNRDPEVLTENLTTSLVIYSCCPATDKYPFTTTPAGTDDVSLTALPLYPDESLTVAINLPSGKDGKSTLPKPKESVLY